MSEILLQTKLYKPVQPPSLVARTPLVNKLDVGLNGKLTLVSAPAGFGKTTLIGHWGQQLEAAGAWQFSWLSLDENDNEVIRFFTYFIAALQKIDGRIGQSTLELLQGTQTDNIQLILTDLLNSLAQAPQAILLALDDYYQITQPTIHESIQFLIENAPPNFHLLLLSRTDPPLPLARLRARRQMTEIRQDDLRFSAAEVTQFLNQLMALDLPETAVSALEKRTEGWIAGLQMAALSLQGHPDKDRFITDFTGSHRYIFDYLTEEVLAGQSDEIRAFLLQTAVLDRLCAPLCDALLAQTRSQQLLEQLEAANLFLSPLDDARHWYRYHQLFGELLRQQLRQENPQLESTLHSRASAWFEHAGFIDEAVQHALAAADYERASNLIAHHSQPLVHHGEMSKLLSWINRLPDEWQHRQPQLILNHAWAVLFRGSSDEMEATLSYLPDEVVNSLPYSAYLLVLRGISAIRQDQIEKAISLGEAAEAQLTTLEQNEINVSMRGVNALVLGNCFRLQDKERAAQFYQTAASLSRESGNLISYLTAVRDQGQLLLEQGKLHQAEAVFREGIQFEEKWGQKADTPGRKLLAAAPIHVSLGKLLYEWNRLDEAEAHLTAALRLLVLVGPVNQSEGLVAFMRLRLAQGNRQAALPLLTQLETLHASAQNQFTRLRLRIAIAEAGSVLYQQEPTPTLRFKLEQSVTSLDKTPQAKLAEARMLLALSQPAAALPILETLAKQMQENDSFGLWLSAIILLSLAQQQVGNSQEAIHSLGQALAFAASRGHIRRFVDAGPLMAGLLQTAVRQQIQAAYAAQVLTHFPQTEISSSPPVQTETGPLSPRETEVLQLIVQGLTNKAIAAKLVIAPSTAKRHTVNIYNKLGVSNRAEATAKAYELGLVNAA